MPSYYPKSILQAILLNKDQSILSKPHFCNRLTFSPDVHWLSWIHDRGEIDKFRLPFEYILHIHRPIPLPSRPLSPSRYFF